MNDNKAVLTSFAVSTFDFSLNLVVALISGSAVLLSQAMQGLSDLFTAGALLVGVRRSRKRPDDAYQFGYGREVFFYATLAAMVMFVGTGLLSVYFGYRQLVAPETLQSVGLGIGLLIFGVIGNAYAAWRSAQRLRANHPDQSLLSMARSTLVETKTTFAIDSIGTIAAFFGLISLSLYALTGNVAFDGVGSIIIGLTTMTTAALLLSDVRSLIVGRAVRPELAGSIEEATLEVDGVQRLLDLRTMYVGPAELLVIVEVHLRDELTTDSIELIADQVKDAIKARVPQVRIVQVEAETPDHELRQT